MRRNPENKSTHVNFRIHNVTHTMTLETELRERKASATAYAVLVPQSVAGKYPEKCCMPHFMYGTREYSRSENVSEATYFPLTRD